MADTDIDLYADDAEFSQDGEYNHDSNVDLYDDVISSPSRERADDERSPSSESTSPRQQTRPRNRRIAVYVGNLTWWTTDQDVIEAIKNLGAGDVISVKFHENRANGQSKGFCVVTLGSENALRIVTEKLPKKELHGQHPVVTQCTRQNLNYFELQSRKGGQSGNRHEKENYNDRRGRDKERDNRDNGRGSVQDRSRNRNDYSYGYQPQHHQQQRPVNEMPRHPMPQGPPPPQYQPSRVPWVQAPPPQLQIPPPNRPGVPPPMTTGGLPHPGIPTSLPPPRPAALPPGNLRIPPPRGPPPPIVSPRTLLPDTRGPPPVQHEWERPNVSQPPPQQITIPPQSIVATNRPPPPMPAPGQVTPTVPPPPHIPNPHINPAFFQPGVPPGLATTQAADIYSRPPPTFPEYRPSERSESSAPSISEAECEEIMGRNKSVSSSAIARAVADASAGDYASAIETLVTAISLIKQSKVADDERCKILVSSLKDTLHGIESKFYGSRSKERARSRERDRSRERSSRREKSSRRDRSRSRDRDYRDRSRERDRYHEDRYRDKDHDRDRRSSRH